MKYSMQGEKGLKTEKKVLPLVIIMLLTAAATPMILGIPSVLAQTGEEIATVVVSQIYDVQEDQVNTTILVQINVTGAVGLQGYVMNLSWDPTMLRVTETSKQAGVRPLYPALGTTYYALSRGDFLNTTSSNFGVREVNNTLGTIWYLWQMRSSGGQIGRGVLVTINFTILRLGTTRIELSSPASNALAKDPNYDSTKSRLQNANDGTLIPHEEFDGVFSDQPPPVPPIWSQLWFLASVAIVAIVGLPTLVIVAYSKTHKPEKDKVDWDKYEEDEV
jgi:hypothetical protein